MPDRLNPEGRALYDVLQEIRGELAQVRKRADAAPLREEVPTREDLAATWRRGKWTVAGAFLTALAIAFMGWYSTFRAAEQSHRDAAAALTQMRTDVVACFFSPGRLTTAQVDGCDRKFPVDPEDRGRVPTFKELQRLSAERTAQFNTLVAQIPVNRWRIGRLEDRVDRLERAQAGAR